MEFLFVLAFFYYLYYKNSKPEVRKKHREQAKQEWRRLKEVAQNQQRIHQKLDSNEERYQPKKIETQLHESVRKLNDSQPNPKPSKYRKHVHSDSDYVDKNYVRETAYKEKMTTTVPSHKREHIHSNANYDRKKYSSKDLFKNDSVPVHVALKKVDPAVNKGMFDKADRGRTIERNWK